jgi:DNA-binding MarR family transcriptional regulator
MRLDRPEGLGSEVEGPALQYGGGLADQPAGLAGGALLETVAGGPHGPLLASGLSHQVLADRFHRSKVAAFQLINQLEKQGLVARRPHPTDKRSNLIYLTPKGRAVESELIPLAQENLVRALDGIRDAELVTTRSVLCRIIDNMNG